MEKNDILKILRREINDNIEPFQYKDEYLEYLLESAVSDYTRYRPLVKSETLKIKKGQNLSPLPEDFQKWRTGFEKYDCLLFNTENVIINPAFNQDIEIKYTYYANHTINTIARNDIIFIMDFCFWKFSNNLALSKSEIESIKVGNNLSLKTNISKIMENAEKRIRHYNDNVIKASFSGGWI